MKLKSCKDYFFIDPEGTMYSIFDPLMTLAIVYACVTSAFYASFGMPPNNDVLSALEWVVFGFFFTDIILNFMVLRKDKDGKIMRSHLFIAKHYAARWFFFDVLATFPFGALLK
jgi:hypothetical protein